MAGMYPLRKWIQAVDVTEIHSYGLVGMDEAEFKEVIKTEFAWVVTALPGKTVLDALKRLKFEEFSRMSNHFPGHLGQRYHLSFWWKYIGNHFTGKVQREYWHCDTVKQSLTASGCGFKMGEPPFKGSLTSLANYFSLIRVPNTAVVSSYEKVLARRNFHKLQSGERATFFVNGWRKGWTYDKESEFFAKGGIVEEHQKRQRRLPNRDKMGRFSL